ncbi:hypothetical protein ASF10_22220 [Flavobacterium sp. Leaf82]|uniref:hypothetical protein n=1 Tax=Flavobacterium sp. Leaf82 TaxID=1736238 RepID=UPI0006F3BE19|nr:hypothetical protein [Flavobacterium sp. Leaf82]KQO30722.1 hypothetical protein ASF10_22220 [Flavobacterium sp. Leaf82]
MQSQFELSNKILKILTQNHDKTFTLEELTAIVINNSSERLNNTPRKRENQARILDTIIVLESEGLIFLNSFTDESQINTRKYLKIV